MKINDQLCLAAEAGSLGMFRDLLEAGADVSHHMYPDLLTPLLYAALNGHTDIAALCLARGASVNETDDWNRTAYHWAAYNGHLGAPAPRAQCFVPGGPSLTYAGRAGAEVARLLVRHGADVMRVTKGGWTAYNFAGTFQCAPFPRVPARGGSAGAGALRAGGRGGRYYHPEVVDYYRENQAAAAPRPPRTVPRAAAAAA
jgi:ankyrin repeat protein